MPLAAPEQEAAVRPGRDGVWAQIDAARLVLGDGDYLRVDQSALTGESLPVGKRQGEVAYSGSVAAQGSMTAVVTATGAGTYFGKTTRLVAAGHPAG